MAQWSLTLFWFWNCFFLEVEIISLIRKKASLSSVWSIFRTFVQAWVPLDHIGLEKGSEKPRKKLGQVNKQTRHKISNFHFLTFLRYIWIFEVKLEYFIEKSIKKSNFYVKKSWNWTPFLKRKVNFSGKNIQKYLILWLFLQKIWIFTLKF